MPAPEWDRPPYVASRPPCIGTLNRLKPSKPAPTRYHKVSHDAAAIETPLVDVLVEADDVDLPPNECANYPASADYNSSKT